MSIIDMIETAGGAGKATRLNLPTEIYLGRRIVGGKLAACP
jgi:hypothetical protein